VRNATLAYGLCALLFPLFPVVAMGESLLYSRIAVGVDIAGEEQTLENSSSRFGFRGARDLGGGNSVIGRLEFGLDGSSANLSPADQNRLSFIGFKGAWGEFRVGSIWSAYFNKVGARGCDTFTLACFSSMTLRLADSIGYSGSYGRLGVEATASFGESDLQTRPDPDDPTGDPIVVTGDFEDDGIAQTQLAFSYDFGGLALSLGIDNNDRTTDNYFRTGIGAQFRLADLGIEALITTTDPQASNDDIDEFALTLDYRFGPHSLTSEVWALEHGAVSDDAIMLGYLYRGIPRVQLGLAYQTQDSVEDDRLRIYLRHDF